jgi:anti-sigma-K factor RskA
VADSNQTCARIRQLLEPYVVDALDETQRREVAAHLEQCADCRRLAVELADVVHSLPAAVAAASPLELPSSLKDRLLRSPEVTRRRTGAPASPDGSAGAPRRLPRWLRLRTALAVATLALIALFVAWNARLDDALSQKQSLRARLSNVIGNQEIVFEVVDSRKTVKAFLRPPEGTTSTAYGKVFTRPDLPYVVAMANRLPQPPPGRAYHLWLTSEGRTRLAGVLGVNTQGFAVLVLKAGRPGPVYEQASVILQPKGSRQPRGSAALVWRRPA